MSPFLRGWQNKLQAPWQAHVINPLQAMPERDRMALLLAGLALVAAADWFVVWPMNQQRDSIVQAALQESKAALEANTQAELARTLAQAAFDLRARQLDADLAQLGMAQTSGQQLSVLLNRALQQNAVQVLGLREVAAEAIETAAPGPTGADGQPAPASASTAAAPGLAPASAEAATAALPVALYRHRFELRLRGEVPALLVALSTLERDVKPLRIARLRLQGAEGKQAQLTLALVVLSTERVWLSL